MDKAHKVGDYVTVVPNPPVVGKVVAISENGLIRIKWPSGLISTHSGNNFQTYLSAQQVTLLDS